VYDIEVDDDLPTSAGPGADPQGLILNAAKAYLAYVVAETFGVFDAIKPKEQEAGPLRQPPEGLAVATFAGGCFWCMQAPFEGLPGVQSIAVGYTGGQSANPTYKEVCFKDTGHYEAVRVTYDPSQVTYEQLLDAFWNAIDPGDAAGQFADQGPQYRSAVFVHSEEQRRAAMETADALQQSGILGLTETGSPKAVATAILDAEDFWPAETYHQDYAKKSALSYTVYRTMSGRDARLDQLWGGQAQALYQAAKQKLKGEFE
jgi:methionine-S-sulfoxide reductase